MTKYQYGHADPERDAGGRPIRSGDPDTRTMREAREDRERNTKARAAMAARRTRAIVDAANERYLEELHREDDARRALEEHAHRLAQELEWKRQRSEPNPWLKPGDSGYVSSEEWAIRRRLQEEARPVPVDAVDAVLLQRRSRRRPDKECIGTARRALHMVPADTRMTAGRCADCNRLRGSR